MEVLYTADGTINPAEGARGGGPGALSTAHKRELDGSLTKLPACYGVKLEPGEYRRVALVRRWRLWRPLEAPGGPRAAGRAGRLCDGRSGRVTSTASS